MKCYSKNKVLTLNFLKIATNKKYQEQFSEANAVNKFVIRSITFNKDMYKMCIISCDIFKEKEHDIFLKVWTRWGKKKSMT